MEPTIAPGDVVIDQEIRPSEAKVGDIVTFRDPEDEHKLLTHRVVKIRRHDSHMWFTTQGHATTPKSTGGSTPAARSGGSGTRCHGSATSPSSPT
jgi:signal peptidase I